METFEGKCILEDFNVVVSLFLPEKHNSLSLSR